MLKDDITRKEWERWENAERSFRAHPGFYRFKLALLFLEGVVVGVLVLGVVALLVTICVLNPGKSIRLIVFLVLNLFYTAKVYFSILAQRPWNGLPELREKDWPRLYALVGETAKAVGAPRIHRIYLDPCEFNASVSVAFPLVPGLRRNILIIGYPLLAALGESGLRGALAHELGHVAHHDTVNGGALLHVRAFWVSIQLGVFTLVLNPWRRSYLSRIDRLMVPIERERELAADRSISQRFGIDTLRETLVALELRGPDAGLGDILKPVAIAEPGAPASPAEAIRGAMRRAVPEDEARRRIERALRSIVPPMEEHPPLAVRAGTSDVAELMPFASVPQDAIESVFGSADALDGKVDENLRPVLESAAQEIRDTRASLESRLAAIPAVDPTPDQILDRMGVLIGLDRKDEALEALRAGREAHPDNAALETAELCDRLSKAASAEEGAPLADRLEKLIEAEPMMRVWAEDPLMAHYLEIGSSERIKNLLDLLRHGKKTLSRQLEAKLRPTDNISAEPLSDVERANLANAFAGHSVKEVYAVRRVYEGMGTHSGFLVVRWGFLADAGNLLAAFNEAFEDYTVVAGTQALFKRFAELGIKPIPVPKKAPKE